MTVGELYKRLVVLPPKKYHSYYQKTKDTIAEAKEEFDDIMKTKNRATQRLCLLSWAWRWFGNV